MNSLRSTVDESVKNLRGAGFGAVHELVSRSYLRYARSLESDEMFDADWDVLVVLDACRADLWDEVAGDYDLPTGESRISPGGTSTEWLSTVFGTRTADELADVGYVTANPYSASHIDHDDFAFVEEVWRDGWDDDVGTTPPRQVTAAAVQAGRTKEFDRLVVHYMQPHFPSLADDHDDGIALDDFGEESLSVWEDFRFGNRTYEEVWAAYRANLEIVLDDVELLRSNLDGERAVITADHGNAMGELGIYGHAAGIALPELRTVPWAVTMATDDGTYDPVAAGDLANGDEPVDADVASRLEQLGYR
ncbi:hypothetical protein [Haloarchaeobius litoreus]|uniref:Type I phosphodiesterase / nucleotide pyrophosphatase n=1 Tax=Haloarchaeobius litoreus TaxID=755306 RepID=A0ABD6DMW9_9EURY|nr:hypothetical protein [Haloarchaeobius litoreus]